MKKSVSILIMLVIILTTIVSFSACKKIPKETASSEIAPSSSSESSSQTISSESSLPVSSSERSYTRTEILGKEYPIAQRAEKLSIKSMPKKYGYMLNEEEEIYAQKKLEEFKKTLECKNFLNETGLKEFPATLDNAYKAYRAYSNEFINETLQNTHDVYPLISAFNTFEEPLPINQDSNKGRKVINFYFRFFNELEQKYEYADLFDFELITRLESYKEIYDSYVGYKRELNNIEDQLMNQESFEGLKKDLGVKKITEIICFEESQRSLFTYFNTDKGEFVSDCYFGVSKSEYIMPLDTYIKKFPAGMVRAT